MYKRHQNLVLDCRPRANCLAPCQFRSGRLQFFKVLRKLRAVLEAEFWLLTQRVQFVDTNIFVTKNMLLSQLISLEPETQKCPFNPAELVELVATRTLAGQCRELLLKEQHQAKVGH